MHLIDTHAHLDFPQFKKDLPAVLENAGQAGLKAVINVGTSEESSCRVVEQASRYSRIWAAVGVHPHDTARVSTGYIEKLAVLGKESRVVAVGETGLDFYRNLSPAAVQEKRFIEHLELACHLKKPVIIHSRDANEDTLRVLKKGPLPPERGVMHCFSGSLQEAHAFLDLGFYISVAGPVTFPRNHDLRKLVKEIPLHRLLLETDSPYLSPQPYRGKRNEPAFIRAIYERVARALEMNFDELAHQVSANALGLFQGLSMGL